MAPVSCCQTGVHLKDGAVIMSLSIRPQEGAVGSVCVSGLVRSADSDPSGEPGARGAGGHLLQHAHIEPDTQCRGRTPPAQKGESNVRRCIRNSDFTEQQSSKSLFVNFCSFGPIVRSAASFVYKVLRTLFEITACQWCSLNLFALWNLSWMLIRFQELFHSSWELF